MLKKILGALRYKFTTAPVRAEMQKQLMAELRPLLRILGVTPSVFIAKQIQTIVIYPHVLFIEDGPERRRQIRDAIIDVGLVSDHRLRYMKVNKDTSDALAKWIEKGA